MSAKAKDEITKLDLDPDAWPKFEKLIKAAAKRGPLPRGEKKAGTRKASPRRKD